MTFKTILIALALVAGFVGFLSVTWDISAWMVREPVAVNQPEPAVLQPEPKIEANTSGEAEPEAQPTPQAKKDDADTVESGAYDDSWSGSEPPRTGPANEPAVVTQPSQSSGSTSTGSNALADPYAPDLREVEEPEAEIKPNIPSLQSDDPYKGDERETN